MGEFTTRGVIRGGKVDLSLDDLMQIFTDNDKRFLIEYIPEKDLDHEIIVCKFVGIYKDETEQPQSLNISTNNGNLQIALHSIIAFRIGNRRYNWDLTTYTLVEE